MYLTSPIFNSWSKSTGYFYCKRGSSYRNTDTTAALLSVGFINTGGSSNVTVSSTYVSCYLLHNKYYLRLKRRLCAGVRLSAAMMFIETFPLNDGGVIPKIAFGTGTTFFNRNEAVADCIVKAVKNGYRLIDTAVMYGTEVGVGIGIKRVLDLGLAKREELFVTTKLPPLDQSFEKVDIFCSIILSHESLHTVAIAIL